MGDTSGPIIGSNLSLLLDISRKHKQEMKDDFVSVEHLVLAFQSDKRFGQQLFRNLQLSEKDLKEAVQAVRGNQRVTDQSMNALLYILDLKSNYRIASTGKINNLISKHNWEIAICKCPMFDLALGFIEGLLHNYLIAFDWLCILSYSCILSFSLSFPSYLCRP